MDKAMDAMEAVRRGVQALLERRREAVRSGAKPMGWKAAFGSPEVRQRLGLPHLLVGFLTDQTVLKSGAMVSLRGWKHPVAEPEVALRLRMPVLPGSTPEVVARAVEALAPAIELADVDRAPAEDWEGTIAGNVFHRYVVVGESRPAEFRGSLAGLRGQVVRNGTPGGVVEDLEALPGRVVDVLREMAQLLAKVGEGLQAGDLVICGSVVPPQALEPDDRSMEFRLEGFGEVSVHLRA